MELFNFNLGYIDIYLSTTQRSSHFLVCVCMPSLVKYLGLGACAALLVADFIKARLFDCFVVWLNCGNDSMTNFL